MSFTWPTIEQILYRITRLYRLVAIAVAIPTLVILTVALQDPSVLSAGHATLGALGLAGLVLCHVALFPNATLETIALSVSAATLIILMPLLKLLSFWAPADYATGAFVLLLCFAVAVIGALMALFQFALGALLMAGPVWNKPLTASIALSCTQEEAFKQFALRPKSRRGRVLTGEVDDNGFFDVAVAIGQSAMTPAVVRLDATVMQSSPDRHDVMLVLPDGSITVTSQTYEKTADGCKVSVSDLPNDFTIGMHLLFWVTDQAMDHLTETVDTAAGQSTHANSAAHTASAMAVASALFSSRVPASQRAS